MSVLSRSSALLVGCVCAAALVAPGSIGISAAAAGAAADAAVVRTGDAHVLAKTPQTRFPVGALGARVLANDQGLSLAMWTPYTEGKEVRLEWAVARPGKPWTRTKVKAAWRGSPHIQNAFPKLATSSHHRITATWLEFHRIMAANWSPAHGWSKPFQLSGPRERPYIPTIVSNQAGQVAVSWTSHPGDFDHPESAVVAVRRGGTWQRTRVGPSAFNGTPSIVDLGMAADGTVTAAWEDMVDPINFPGLARRLPAGSTTWEPINRFGSAGALAVQPDGAAALDTIQHLFTRVGRGDWTDQGRPPFHVGAAPQTMPSGALFGWGTHVYLDPDGIAGPTPGTDIGSAPNGGQPFATTDNTLVAVSGHGHNVTISTWTPANGWSDLQVVYTDPHRRIVNPPFLTANMTLDGQTTVLFATHPAGKGSRAPRDLEAIRFDATP